MEYIWRILAILSVHRASNEFERLKYNDLEQENGKESANYEVEQQCQDVEYLADDSSSDPSHDRQVIQPTKCSMNAPKPMMSNIVMYDKEESDSSGNSDDDSILNEASDLMNEGCDGSPQSATITNSLSQIYHELEERKNAMINHYYINHSSQYVLMFYFGVTLIIFSILLVTHSARFNDATFYKTSATWTDLEVAKAEIALPKVCSFNFSRLIKNTKAYDKREWILVSDDLNASYIYSDSQKWIGLSVLSLVLCVMIYWLLLFVESCLLIYRFDYFEEHGFDPLFYWIRRSKRYCYPNSPYLTVVFDQNWYKGTSRTPPQTKNVDWMLDETIDDENSDDIMQSVADAANNIIQEEKEEEMHCILKLSPIQEANTKANGNKYLDETLIMFDKDGQLLDAKQPYIVFNNAVVSDDDYDDKP